MTMSVPEKADSHQNPVSSKCKIKLTQMKTWDAKRNLVKKRLMGLTQIMKNEEPENVSVPIISSRPEVETTGVCHSSVGVSTSAMDRALEIQANLSPRFPSCLKLMLPSHVSGGFWLGLPKQFCNLHLPKQDVNVVLVDENDKGYNTKYLVNKRGLSGGWRGFSNAHRLLEGDVVIFQCIEVDPCKLKVYIVRASRLAEVDGAISLLNLDFVAKPMETDRFKESTEFFETDEQNYPEPLLTLENHKEKDAVVLISNDELCGEDSDINSGSEILEGIRFSKSVITFENIKKFEDFAIQVDGLILDSEIPTHLRRKFYKLCRSQNMFLHDNLVEGLNVNLVTGIISETINIADAIREVKSTMSVGHLQSWDRTLKAFEDLGMAVGFLRARISKLLSVFRESEALIESKRRERVDAENEMRCLEEKLRDVGALVKRLDAEIDDLRSTKEQQLDLAFMKVASSSW